ncbi:hypothetical protein AALP_AA8G442400 [Arabis alpina]|uniref:C2H2-type domain-containing protein n=1 Tax=Arabis alpina TaxID=50452 RepID=A0A087GDD5_ARAAL|nr:hypothetical protein AALP_AA8G442400 [Arabis alpina]
MTTAATEYQTAKTSVWWDIENCEVPRGWDAHAIAQNVSSALLKMNYGGPVSITAYGDTNLIPHVVQQALSSTGVGLNHVPAGIKDASDKKILVDMLLWAIDNPAPANYMLISGDRDFSYALHQLRMRRYNILLAQPLQASVPLVAAARNVWLWTSLASGGPPLTSAESSRLLSNGRGQVSNNEVSKLPVSEQAQSSKTTASTSDAGDAKVHKTRENHVTRGLPQETRRNMFQNGRGASGESVTACRISNVVCDSFAHLSDKRPISQAAFVDNHRAQASFSAKPIQDAELVECKVCQIFCSSKDAYKKHTYGKRHRNNLELQSGKSNNISAGPAVLPKDILEKQKKTVNENSANPNTNLVCLLCNVVCKSQIVFDYHLRGKKHASMLSQPEALIDSKPQEKVCQSQIVFDSHLRGQKHAAMLGQLEPLVDSKKLQEKVVGVKDQPRETIPEPKPNTEHVFDSHLRGQKHAETLSQSKALIDSEKLQENGVGENDQTRETIAEPKPKAEHVCRICNVVCHSQLVFDSHLRGKKHVAMLSQSNAFIDSKEKGVEEKEPGETIAELQLQSQNAQENSMCFEKHVVMVNQSEALNNSMKLEEKVVQEKAQPIETVAENQSQYQNTEENINFFETQNEEFREICGTSESSVTEVIPSAKDRVETVDKQLPNGELVFGDLRCDFDVPTKARECYDGIVKPVNLLNGTTKHSGKLKKICNLATEMTNLSKRQARPAASKLCNLCVVICDRQGLSTVFCDDKGHWMNQKHITAAAFVASDDAQSSVSTKPVKEPEVLQPVWCQVCEMSCISKDTYKNHTYGKKHRQKLELQSAKNENMSKGPAKLSKENAEKKKKVLYQNQTALYSQLKSRNHAAIVKEQAEKALVDSMRTQQESDQEKPREALEQGLFVDSRKIREESSQEKETTEEHTLVKTDDLGFRGAEEDKEEVKEINAISENLARVFTGPNRESRIPKESRGCLDVIPDVNATEKLKDESKHKPLEPENKSEGRKEHPGEATKREDESKGQVDNFWTRLWGIKR